MTTTATPAPELERLMSTKETADYLGVPPNTLAKWRMVHKGPRFVRVGKYVKYYPSQVREWIEQNGPVTV